MSEGRGGLCNGSLRDVLLSPSTAKDNQQHLMGNTKNTKSPTSSKIGLTWKSLRSVSGTMEGTIDPRGHFFPAKLAMSAGLIKLLISVLMIGLGALSIILEAALSNLGGGLWVGAVVGVSGFLGVCAARRPHVWVYVLGFMTLGGISMASSGVLLVLSATAWARDNQRHTAVFIHQESQEEVEVLGEVLLRRPSVLVSGALVILAVVDCLVSLSCIVISAREACGLYTKTTDRGLAEGHNRKERLYRWLGQQKTIFPMRPVHPPPQIVSSVSQFVPLSSCESSSSGLSPTKTFSTDPGVSTSNSSSNSPHQPDASGRRIQNSSSSRISSSGNRVVAPNPKSPHIIMTPNPKYPEHSSGGSSHSLLQVSPNVSASSNISSNRCPHKTPHFIAVHPQRPRFPSKIPHSHQPHMRAHPRPHHRMFHIKEHRPFVNIPRPHIASHTAHPSLFYPHLVTPMMPYYPYKQKTHNAHKEKHRSKKEHHQKQAKKKEKKEKKEKRRRRQELTDEQIEKSYTGLDREIAEGFINSAMEPGISINRALNSSFEQDSF